MDYKNKYLKYKKKYLLLKDLLGGSSQIIDPTGDKDSLSRPEREQNIDRGQNIDRDQEQIIDQEFIEKVSSLTQETIEQNIKDIVEILSKKFPERFFLKKVPEKIQSINKCKHIKNEFMNADIYMNYNKDQKQRILLNNDWGLQINDIANNEPVYYCFLITNKGIKFSKINDLLEFGASHMMIPNPIEDEFIIIAGEIEVTKTDDGPRILYNFESGSVNYGSIIKNYIDSKFIEADDKLIVTQYLNKIDLFIYYKFLTEKLITLSINSENKNIEYVNEHLIAKLESQDISNETWKQICTNPKDRNTTFIFEYKKNDNDNDKDDDFNENELDSRRCTKNSLFRMKPIRDKISDQQISYFQLDSDINTIKSFEEEAEYQNIVEKIHQKKLIKDEKNSKTYSDYLACRRNDPNFEI